MRKVKGGFETVVDKETTEYLVATILNPPKHCVLTLTPIAMQSLRQLKAGAVTDFTIEDSQGRYTSKYKIYRRDWKRCKVHMLEVK